jgi:hypothetical protein
MLLLDVLWYSTFNSNRPDVHCLFAVWYFSGCDGRGFVRRIEIVRSYLETMSSTSCFTTILEHFRLLLCPAE